MKAVYKFIIMSGLFILGCTTIVPAVAQEPTEAGKTELTVTGTVRDRETRKKLENVTVALAVSYATMPDYKRAKGIISSGKDDGNGSDNIEME